MPEKENKPIQDLPVQAALSRKANDGPSPENGAPGRLAKAGEKKVISAFQVALAGVMGALGLTFLLAGSILPAATYVAPALAGVMVALVAQEAGRGTGWMLYCALSLSGLLLVPEKELVLIFMVFMGYYPLLKAPIQRLAKALAWAVKLALFNACMVGLYAAMLFVFPVAPVVEEFAAYSIPFIVVLLALGNLAFIFYDLALGRGLLIYKLRLSPLLRKGRGR